MNKIRALYAELIEKIRAAFPSFPHEDLYISGYEDYED